MSIREETLYEGGPHPGDLILNILIGLTVIGIPLTVGAVVRALWLRYRITNRRVSVTGGWMGRDRTDIVYSEITKVATVPRGLGLWGDMVLTLRNGSRLELRALPRFRELSDFIEEKMASRGKQSSRA
ncbi:MAG: PH domain-containing protein [Cyanobacteriota bacterium]|nr:PH domain-containing protein [Cyanobacteriota bacterium]